MTMRISLSIGFLLLAAVMLYFSLHNENNVNDLLLNLGSEIVGIVITVALVDALQDYRRKREEARRIAWDVLHDLDHAMWVWQGGVREFEIEELFFVCDLVKDEDPFPNFTQNLLLRLGSRCENTFRTGLDKLKANNHLYEALNKLKDLATIRNKNIQKSNREIAAIIKSAVGSLAFAVQTPVGIITSNESSEVYDASILYQEWRHFGEPLRK